MSLALRSELLSRHSLTHGFSLRTGGRSEGPFASLNLGRVAGENHLAYMSNQFAYARDVGFARTRLFEANQVHGSVVRVIRGDEDPFVTRDEDADALVTKARGVAIGVRVADCLPLLLADPTAGVVGAVHAGWRGVASEITSVAIDEMVKLGASTENLVASIGPHIRACCFEVGDEVVEALSKVAHGAIFVETNHGPKPHVVLANLVRAQLEARGLSAASIDDVPGCTSCDSERFFSHRRDKGKTGRHLAVIALAP